MPTRSVLLPLGRECAAGVRGRRARQTHSSHSPARKEQPNAPDSKRHLNTMNERDTGSKGNERMNGWMRKKVQQQPGEIKQRVAASRHGLTIRVFSESILCDFDCIRQRELHCEVLHRPNQLQQGCLLLRPRAQHAKIGNRAGEDEEEEELSPLEEAEPASE